MWMSHFSKVDRIFFVFSVVPPNYLQDSISKQHAGTTPTKKRDTSTFSGSGTPEKPSSSDSQRLAVILEIKVLSFGAGEC